MGNITERKFEFLPLTIRLETLGGVATPLVLRGTPLPATRSEEFSTAAEKQVSVEVKLVVGESPLVRNNTPLGTFHLEGIPPQGAGEPKILVEFSVAPTCAVTARATLRGSQLHAEQTFQPPEPLSDDFIAKLLTNAESSRAADEADLRRIELTNSARGLIREAERQLKQGPNAKLSEAIAALGLALSSGNTKKMREKTDALNLALEPHPSPFNFSHSSPFNVVFEDLFGAATRKPAANTTPKAASQTRTAPPGDSLAAAAPVSPLGKIFGGGTFTLDPQLCFVLMPFADRFQPLYDDHIRPTVQRAGLRCERADEIHGPTLITSDIWERINRSRVLIAELTNQNANVFYELGLAHALGKDVILITQSTDFVPFDLRAIRFIRYDFTPRGTRKLEDEIAATLDTLIKSA
jgi:hypothetical protein